MRPTTRPSKGGPPAFCSAFVQCSPSSISSRKNDHSKKMSCVKAKDAPPRSSRMIWSACSAGTCSMVGGSRSRTGMLFPRFRTPFSAISISARCRSTVSVSIRHRGPPAPTKRRSNPPRFAARRLPGASGQGPPRKMGGARCLGRRGCRTAVSEDVALDPSCSCASSSEKGRDDDVADPGIRVNAVGREPRVSERFEALIARAYQHFPVTEVRVAVNGVHEIDDHALLVGANTIKSRR